MFKRGALFGVLKGGGVMNKILFALLGLCVSLSVVAGTHVNGYTKKDGTYVQGYARSSPDQYRYNNNNSETNGGYRKDEHSNYGATNKSNSSYGGYDNDNDGISNSFDSNPEKKSGW